MRSRRVSPSLAVAMLALFVALGGSALAVSAARPVAVCGNGSVKGYASVQLDTYAGGFPQTFSNAAKEFAARWSCNGRSPDVRSAGAGTFQIRFPGVAFKAAVGSVYTTNGARSSHLSASISGGVITVDTGDTGNAVGFSIAVF